MGSRDQRVDAYIAKAAPFAQPILAELRERVHAACPEVVESLKWSMPAFDYRGPLAGMAGFKKHCAFGFWKSKLVLGDDAKAEGSHWSYGCIASLEDLPAKSVFARQVKTAMRLNEQGVKVERSKQAKAPVALHPEFAAALRRNKRAKAVLDGFTPSQQREYLEWIADAKKDDTRARRIEQAVEWLAEGKTRNWKYQ